MQQDLYRAIQHPSRITGERRYDEAVRVALGDFLRITQHPETGLLAWGEHLYWDFVEDRLGDIDNRAVQTVDFFHARMRSF